MKRKLKITKEAKTLINKGFKGNGCGSGVVSKILCFAASKFINIELSVVWLYHDAEYTVKPKSVAKKIQADTNAHYNINILAGLNPDIPVTGFKGRFAKVVHALLILKGSSAYWRED